MEKSKRHSSIGCVAALRLPQAELMEFYNDPATGTWVVEKLGLMTYNKIRGNDLIVSLSDE